MGRQGGIGRFLGSWGEINGYVDDGKVFWRRRSSLDKKRWSTLPSMRGQREAARLFGAASLIAGDLWKGMPPGMRRLADAGAFNRLVGTCRILQDDDGNISDLDGLRGLDLSLDSSGPQLGLGSEQVAGSREQLAGSSEFGVKGSELDSGSSERCGEWRVERSELRVSALERGEQRAGSSEFRVKGSELGLGSEQGAGSREQLAGSSEFGVKGSELGLGSERGTGCGEWRVERSELRVLATGRSEQGAGSSELGVQSSELGLGSEQVAGSREQLAGFRLVGMNALVAEMDRALGASAGRRSGKYVVANKLIVDGICRETLDHAQLGSCRGWGIRNAQSAIRNGRLGVTGLRPVRRARVWVWACEVPALEWHAGSGRFLRTAAWRGRSAGIVTSWEQDSGIAGFLDLERGFAASYDVVFSGSREQVVGSSALGGGAVGRGLWDRLGEGCYVVFTAVEMAEKRGRHWVGLPWCSRVRVSDCVLIENGQWKIKNGHRSFDAAESSPEEIVSEVRLGRELGLGGRNGLPVRVLGRAVLRRVPRRVITGIRCRDMGSFERWAVGAGRDQDLQDSFGVAQDKLGIGGFSVLFGYDGGGFEGVGELVSVMAGGP